MIRCLLLSRAAFPASSRISAVRYPSTAERQTGNALGNDPKPVTDRQHTWCAGPDALSVVAPLQQTVDTTYRKLKAGIRGARLGL